MSAILEIPEVRRRVSPLSVEEYQVYRRPEAGRYREEEIYGPEDVLLCAAVAGIRLRVAELFAS